MFDLNELARNKASETAQEFADWQNVLSKSYKAFSLQGIKDEEFKQLVEACKNHELMALLTREFFSFSKKDPQQRSAYALLIKEVDESEYDLEQWLEAIEEMYAWLKRNSKTAELVTIFGYLNCCAESPDNRIGQRRFKAVFLEFVEQFGFERAQDIT